MKKLSSLVNVATVRAARRLCKVLALAIVISVSLVAQTESSPAARQIQSSPPPPKASSKSETYYTCPMDPEVRSAKRGKCPKCGMALRLAHADPGPVAGANFPARPKDEMPAGAMTEKQPAGVTDGAPANRKMVIPDAEVLDQDGNSIHFYSDLIKNKTVAINFIFTNCTTICPPLAATFARVQKELGDMVGRDVHFISISVDPVTDTPERLKAWGAKFKAGAGWTFVTGDKQEIDRLLNALGASVARREDHSPTVIIGNDAKGVWTRTYGLARTAQMAGLILNVMEGKTDEVLAKEQEKP